VRKDGGRIKEEIVQDRPVIMTDPVPRLQTDFSFTGRFAETNPKPTVFRQIPDAGEEFRDAYFVLKTGEASVAPNQPKTVYYVLTLNSREPASFGALYAPNGDYYRFRQEALLDALKLRDEEWMNSLRRRAGLDPKWAPKEENNNESSSDAA